jgi:hypothetical protein
VPNFSEYDEEEVGNESDEDSSSDFDSSVYDINGNLIIADPVLNIEQP